MKTAQRILSVLLSVAVASVTCLAGQSRTLIGNLYYSAPNGIAFIWQDEAAFVISPDLGNNKLRAVIFDDRGEGFAQAHLANDYNAGICAPDDSYHRIVMELSDNTLVEFEWTRSGDAAVGRMIAGGATRLRFDLSKNWPGFTNTFSQIEGGIKGVAPIAEGQVSWTMLADCPVTAFDGNSVTFSLGDYTRPMHFVAGFGTLPPLEDVDRLIEKASADYEAARPKAIAPSGDVIGAMTNNLNNTRLYCSDEHTTFIPVSRSFGVKNANQGPIFCWDSFFNGLMATYDNPDMAKATFRAVLYGALPNGMIGNLRHWSMESSTGQSQPPVGSMCIWRSHLLRPDINFLREVYPILKAWNEWWMKYRNPNNNGLLAWGDEKGSLQTAMYETGWDDTPHFQGVRMAGTTMNAYAVDLCSLWAMDAHYLSLIAEAIGDSQAAARHRSDAEQMNRRINEYLWNEDLGIYCSRFFNEDGTFGDFLTKLAPLNFYPLICGAASSAQAGRMLSILTDPEQFWGEWIVPTISRKEPEYHRQCYWSGNIWGPATYLTWLGVKRYASDDVKAEYAQKCVHLFMNNWLGAGYCGENYFTLNGRVCSNPNYTWGALLGLIGIESVVDMDDDGSLRTGTGYNEPVRLENIILGGTPRTVSVNYQKPTVTIK
jgi:hypothetical protein